MDDATVRLMLEIKEQGMGAITEVNAEMGRLREALNKYREAEAAGLGVDRATHEAIGNLMDSAVLAGVGFKELSNEVTDARQALTHYSEAVAAGMSEDAAQAAVLADLAIQYQEVADTADEAAGAEDAAGASSASSGLGALGAAGGFLTMAGTIGLVIVGVQLLLPPLLLVVSALAVLTSFAVAGAGMLALLGGIAVAIGGLGAGTLALGAVGLGTGNFDKAIAPMKEALVDLENQARPLTREILAWAVQGVPAVAKLGSSMMTWFGHELPGILKDLGGLFRSLLPTIDQFGQFLGAMFDRNKGKIAPLLGEFIQFGVQGVEWLLTQLEDLSNWFIQRLPTYGPVVKSILGGAGKVVLDLVDAFGKFADYVVKNWPTWTKEISDAWNKKGSNGKSLGQNLQDTANTDLPQLKQSFEDIMKQAPIWLPVIVNLAIAFTDLATGILKAVDAGEKLIGLIQKNPWLTGPLGFALPGAVSGSTNLNTTAGSAGDTRGHKNPNTSKKTTLNINLTVAPNSTTRLITQV